LRIGCNEGKLANGDGVRREPPERADDSWSHVLKEESRP